MTTIQNTRYVPSRYATDTGREFDPSTECHYQGFTIKVVDPGCTLEIQIEERSGRVTRITTTDDVTTDKDQIRQAVLEALDRFYAEFNI